MSRLSIINTERNGFHVYDQTYIRGFGCPVFLITKDETLVKTLIEAVEDRKVLLFKLKVK